MAPHPHADHTTAEAAPRTASTPRPDTWLAAYPAPGGYDEMVAQDGTLRPLWREFAAQLGRVSPQDLSRRWERGLRLMRGSGRTTASAADDSDAQGRTWRLDPLPFLIDAEDWGLLERGLIQRARLLNAVLKDLYGPRHLIHQGLIPPSLILANPAFLRAVHGARPREDLYLALYAADVARDPGGRWWVLGDRTETPAGLGNARENRSLVSRALPEVAQALAPRRLAPFFAQMRETLVRLSPRTIDDPLIVVWTPGPYAETHHEHVYLARSLGFTLVEGEDMTTRDGRVFLKTLEGLKQVDVILRRNEGSYCDPLELRTDSTLGVPGLVEAVHAGSVSVVNALGARVAESPALAPFLPSLCRRLLGETLILPAVATWWCGQERERQTVTRDLDSLLLRPAFNAHGPKIDGRALAPEERATLLQTLNAQPWEWVGQEPFVPSTAPIWDPGHSGGGVEASGGPPTNAGAALAPLPVVLRVHLVAAENGDYAVLPGGLARVGSRPGQMPDPVSTTRGGRAKDTWVLGDSPGQEAAGPPDPGRVPSSPAPRRGLRDLPSRVADNTYWLGRQAERSADTARLLRKACVLAAETGYGGPELATVLGLFVMLGHLPLGLDLTDPAEQTRALARLLARNADPLAPTGLAATLSALERTATAVRDRLSADAWSLLHGLGRWRLTDGWPAPDPAFLSGATPILDLDTPQVRLDAVITSLLALDGLTLETMTRGLGWRFLDMGRRLERALHLLDLLTGLLLSVPAPSGPALEVALDVSDTLMTYRTRYFGAPALAPAVDLLINDESSPRSLAYQLARLDEHLAKLSVDQAFGPPTEEQRLIARLMADVRALDPRSLVLVLPDDADPAADDGARRAKADPVPLGSLLYRQREGLSRLNTTLTLHYFAHALETRLDTRPPAPADPEDEAGALAPRPEDSRGGHHAEGTG